MRWLFIDPTNRAELEHRARTLARIDAWWEAFVAQSASISALFTRAAEWDLPAWMHEHLGAIHPQLMWEFGPAVRQKGHRLVITPEAEHGLRPIVRALLDRAPPITGWEFYGHRLAESFDQALATVEGRTGESVAGTLFRAQRGRGRRIDLTFSIPFCRDEEDHTALHAAFVACESLLGEKLLDERVGAINVVPPRERWLKQVIERFAAEVDAPWLPLAELPDVFGELVDGLVDELPLQPCCDWIDEARWATIELKPEPQDDYPHRSDLFVAISGALDTWKAAHGGSGFYSGCHSRCSETFCYVKLDGRDGLPDDCVFVDRSEMEDALNAALRREQLGCVTGGGTGHVYSYIDLALADLRLGANLVRETLQQGRVPLRSWVLFFDEELSREWVGVYDETPPPP